MKETDHFYLFWEHQFGQWTKRDMEDIGGITYNCCEQYMMAKKAQLFADEEALAEIMRATSPKTQQQLGREVIGFNPAIWDAHKFAVVWFGNYLKFSQHEDLRDRLLATSDKILAEASPYDLVWGIGYRAEDEEAIEPDKWRGQNLLGKALMSVRSALREQNTI